jgi:AraC-like DNA-binding protein
VLVRLPPPPELSRVVEAFWSFDGAGDRVGEPSPRERALPTGRTNLVFRLSGPPIRVFEGPEDLVGREFGYAVSSGSRSAAYVRDTSSPSYSVGVLLTPHGAATLLRVPAQEISERHVALDELAGRRANEARERMLEASSPAVRLQVLEQVVREWARGVLPCHPAIVRAIERFDAEGGVGSIEAAQMESGLSHRRFVELFERAVGLPPKVYCRIVRFQRAIRHANHGRCGGWAGIAAACGYYDQAHLNREFRALAGLTPGAYAPTSPERPNHVPLASR